MGCATMPNPTAGNTFRKSFDRWAKRVRRRLALEHVLTGAAVGMVVGAAACAAAWQTRHGDLRPLTAGGGIAGAALGAVVARRRRFKDSEVALYLDAKLGSDEAIATAIDLEKRAETAPDSKDKKRATSSRSKKDEEDERDSARAVVITQATAALEKATPKQVRPKVLRLWHAAVPLAAAGIAFMTWLPVPPPPPVTAAPPGTDKIQMADIRGLEKVIKLAELDARDEAQKQRLKQLADEAKKIREKLRQGVEKREAQADIAKLRDAITAERMRIGEGEQRQGLEAALGKLAENGQLKEAEKALGDRDLVQFDEAMEELANKLEKEDREKAQKSLEEAAEAAKKAGAPDVAKALEEQKKLLEERGQKGEKLKELAKALGEGLSQEGKEALNDMQGSGSSKAQQKLAKELEKALGNLSEKERKQLAENLKKQAAAQQGQSGGMDNEPTERQMKELAKQLGTPEGQQQLEEQLREMAKEPPAGSEEAERQKALEDAQKGAGEAEQEMGGGGLPVPMMAEGSGAGKGGGKGEQGGKEGQGGKQEAGANDPNGKGENGGAGPGGGKGEHAGQTGVVDGQGVKARATAKINKGRLMPGMVMGRTAGRPGETANMQGSGALGTVAPDEVGGVERSDVPEEYREQVGRYFQPK
jgi:hypothetical protein